MIYLFLMTGGIYIFFKTTWKHIPSPAVPSIHWFERSKFRWHFRWLVFLAIPAPYISLYILSQSDPGIITPQNYLNHIDVFPYDNILFTPNNLCRTCKFSKPARSKHCEACNACVARQDHHCTLPSFAVDTRCLDRKLCRILQYPSFPHVPRRQRIVLSIRCIPPLSCLLTPRSSNPIISKTYNWIIGRIITFSPFEINVSTLLVGHYWSRIRRCIISDLWNDLCCHDRIHSSSPLAPVDWNYNKWII